MGRAGVCSQGAILRWPHKLAVLASGPVQLLIGLCSRCYTVWQTLATDIPIHHHTCHVRPPQSDLPTA
jgi:hypothetical protein